MLPNQLQAESFGAYPAEARRMADQPDCVIAAAAARVRSASAARSDRLRLEVSRRAPGSRPPVRVPGALSPEELERAMAAFAQLRLTPALEKVDWVNSPAGFTEQLTAHLWTTHQIDAFRAAAVEYIAKSTAAAAGRSASDAPFGNRRHRAGGQGQSVPAVPQASAARHVFHAREQRRAVCNALVEAVAKRAAAHPLPYGHWYIDGGAAAAAIPEGVARVSYAALSPARAALQSRMQKIYEASVFDPGGVSNAGWRRPGPKRSGSIPAATRCSTDSSSAC